MKVLEVVPRRDSKKGLKTLLNEKERELRGSRTTFYRHRAGRWRHKAYSGWIKWDQSMGGALVAEIQGREGMEWQLMQAFVGYLDRHLGDHIESITIRYR